MGKKTIRWLLSWEKIIPLYQLNKTFCPSFKFHSNLSFKKSSLRRLLPFCRHHSWSQSFSGSPETSSLILSHFLWFNKYIKIEGTVVHFPKFSNKGINFLLQLFENGRIISSIHLKERYELTNNMFFQWDQLKHAIAPRWKLIIFDFCGINENDLCQNHHVIKGARILPLYKLFSKEIYSILISNIVNKPTSNISFEKLFENTTLDWNKISLSPRLANINFTLRSFQHKILNKVLFLSKRLNTFGITNTALCSFCNAVEETPIHVFFDILNVFGKDYGWNFRTILSCCHLTTDCHSWTYNKANDNYNLLSHILLIFKYLFIYQEKSEY